MRRILWRCLGGVLVMLGILVATFAMTRLGPGDPAAFYASAPGLTEQDVTSIRAGLGLDRSLPRQFLTYLQGLTRGDLGRSLATGRPVVEELATRVPASLELTLVAFTAAAGLAIPLGVVAALRRGTLWDGALRTGAALGLAVPTFLTSLLLIGVFYAGWGWAPVPIGRIDPFLIPPPRVTGFLTLDAALAGDGAALASASAHLVLPGAAMAIFAAGPLFRVTRAAMANALAADFVVAARVNGVGRRRLLADYALRNAAAPIVGTLAMTLSATLGANVLVETVFAWPGIGRLAVQSALSLDYAALQGIMLVMAAVVVAVTLATDVVQALIDPRGSWDD